MFSFRINYFISFWGESYGFVWVTNWKVNSLKFKSRGKWWRTLQFHFLRWARIGPEPQLAYAMQMFSSFICRLKVPFSLQQRVCLLLRKSMFGEMVISPLRVFWRGRWAHRCRTLTTIKLSSRGRGAWGGASDGRGGTKVRQGGDSDGTESSLWKNRGRGHGRGLCL